MKLFHRHEFYPKKTKYPVLYTFATFGMPSTCDSTAIYEKCRCGTVKVRHERGKWKVWHEFVVQVYDG